MTCLLLEGNGQKILVDAGIGHEGRPEVSGHLRHRGDRGAHAGSGSARREAGRHHRGCDDASPLRSLRRRNDARRGRQGEADLSERALLRAPSGVERRAQRERAEPRVLHLGQLRPAPRRGAAHPARQRSRDPARRVDEEPAGAHAGDTRAASSTSQARALSTPWISSRPLPICRSPTSWATTSIP
jgi:hypothetical protein